MCISPASQSKYIRARGANLAPTPIDLKKKTTCLHTTCQKPKARAKTKSTRRTYSHSTQFLAPQRPPHLQCTYAPRRPSTKRIQHSPVYARTQATNLHVGESCELRFGVRFLLGMEPSHGHVNASNACGQSNKRRRLCARMYRAGRLTCLVCELCESEVWGARSKVDKAPHSTAHDNTAQDITNAARAQQCMQSANVNSITGYSQEAKKKKRCVVSLSAMRA